MKKLLSMFAVLGLMSSFAFANEEKTTTEEKHEVTKETHATKKAARGHAKKAKKAAQEEGAEHNKDDGHGHE